MIEAVVFDLDGVLIDSEPVWEQVRRQVVAEHGGHWAAGAQQRLMGMSTGEWAQYLSRDLGVGLPPETIAAMVIDQMKARYAEHVPFMPGAVAAVRRLAVTGRLGRPPQRCAAVEDSANGLRSAAAAGLRVIAVPHPRYPPGADALSLATLVLPSLTELTTGAVAQLAGESRSGD